MAFWIPAMMAAGSMAAGAMANKDPQQTTIQYKDDAPTKAATSLVGRQVGQDIKLGGVDFNKRISEIVNPQQTQVLSQGASALQDTISQLSGMTGPESIIDPIKRIEVAKNTALTNAWTKPRVGGLAQSLQDTLSYYNKGGGANQKITEDRIPAMWSAVSGQTPASYGAGMRSAEALRKSLPSAEG